MKILTVRQTLITISYSLCALRENVTLCVVKWEYIMTTADGYLQLGA
jgi:hypothetical protein